MQLRADMRNLRIYNNEENVDCEHRELSTAIGGNM